MNEARSHSKSSNRRTRKPAVTKPQNGPVESITVDPLLWRQGFSPDVLLVLAPKVVIVCNSRFHRDYLRKVLTNAG